MATWIGVLLAVVVLSLLLFNWLKARRDPEDVRKALARIDEVGEELLAGIEVTDLCLEESAEAFDRFYRYLSETNHTQNNLEFSAPNRATFYLYAIKLAALQHPNHNAWPLMSSLRGCDQRALLRETDSSSDPWVRLACITPALLQRDVTLATQLVRELPPVLAHIAIRWVQETAVGYAPYNHVPSSERLLQVLGFEVTGPPPPDSDPLPRDQRWALSVAIYPSYGADARVGLGDPLPPAVCRRALEIWWDVDDSESALATLEWLLAAGHRQKLNQELDHLDDVELSLSSNKRAFLRGNSAALRKYSILAWDLCRLVNVTRSAHKAGFIDEVTAWEYVLAAAAELRRVYPSWRALGDDYLLGNRYFSDDSESDAIHRASVEWLQNSPASPWNRVPWDAFAPGAFVSAPHADS